MSPDEERDSQQYSKNFHLQHEGLRCRYTWLRGEAEWRNIIFAPRLNQSYNTLDLRLISVKVTFKNYMSLHLELKIIFSTSTDSAWSTSKIIVRDGNSIAQKEAAHNNMVRNVKHYHDNNTYRSMFLWFSLDFKVIAGLFIIVSLFIDLGCPGNFGKGWRGDRGTFMVSRPI